MQKLYCGNSIILKANAIFISNNYTDFYDYSLMILIFSLMHITIYISLIY